MEKKKYILSALLVVISALPVLLGLDILSILICPALLAFCFVTLGVVSWGTLSLLLFAAVYLVTGMSLEHSVIFAAFAVPVSCLLGYGFSKKQSFSILITPACTVCIAAAAGLIFYLMKKYNMSAFSIVTGDSFKIFKESLQQSSIDTNTAKYIDMIIVEAEQMLPSIIIIACCFYIYSVFGITRRFLEKSGLAYENLRHFYELRLSRGFAILFLGVMLVSLFSQTGGVTMNIITVVTMMFTVCGLSCCDYYLKSKSISKPIRVLIFIAVFIISALTGIGATIVSTALFLLGVVDSFRDLRRQVKDNEVI